MLVQDGLPARERMRALVVIILGIVMAVLDGTIVNLALPDITRELHAFAAQSIWVINAYQIATLALLLPLATLGDIVGYRRVYLTGLAVFTAASVACALADSLTMLALARVLQGLGAAGLMSVNTALVRLIYPKQLLGRGIAINSLVVAIASVAGPSIAAAILSVASWPWLFALNVPFGLLGLILGRSALPQNPAKAEGARFSLLDVVLNGLMFGLIFIGVEGLGVRVDAAPGGAQGAPLWLALAELATGIVVGVIYVRRQLAQPVPLFPLDLLRIPVFALSMGTSIGAFCAQTLAYVGLPFLLLGSYGRSHLEAGLLLTAWPLSIVVMAPLVGRLIGRYSGGLLGGTGLGMLSLGLVLLAMLPSQPANADIVWRMALCGLGFGLFQSPNNHIIITSAPAHRSGGASGMLGTARLTGQTLGAVLLAMIFAFFDPQDGKGPLVALWLAAAFAALAGTCSALRMKRQ
ncbi:MFS transporter [Polaromonas jejuensis]|uniref:MFS transporter n=1 Tax=Polaromonas jejuensis TaxID=457502 RepID=A0ABW0Q6F4_9BURK|nr:MFS transporter [Polaromonas jejuensis]